MSPKAHRTYEVFLASSIGEFARERPHIGADVLAINDAIIDGGDYLKLYLCEDLSKKVNLVRKQDEYNRLIPHADLVIILAGKRLGIYTVEELERALTASAERGTPRVTVFLKECEPDAEAQEGGLTIPELRDRLSEADVEIRTFRTLDDLDELLLTDPLIASLLPEGFSLRRRVG